MKVPRVGGAPLTLASAQDNPGFIAVDSTSVYWANQGTNVGGGLSAPTSLMRVPLGGGAATTVASGLSGPTGIAVGATSVYLTNSGCLLAGASSCTVLGTLMQISPK